MTYRFRIYVRKHKPQPVGSYRDRVNESPVSRPPDHPAVTGARRVLTPSVGDIVFIVVFAAALALGFALTHRDGDLPKHLTVGHVILDTRSIPTVDVYSHTKPDAETVPFEWLSQTAFAAADRLGGFDGIVLLAAVVIAVPFVIVYRLGIRNGASVGWTVALVLLGAAASTIHWAARPHLFSWLFTAIWLSLLEGLRRGRRHQVWVIVPLTVLWVNFHGGFMVGLVLVAVYMIGALIEQRRSPDSESGQIARHLGLVLLASGAASLINPVGVRMALHPFVHLLGDDFIFGVIREFDSPDFHNPVIWPFLAMILISVVLRFRWSATTVQLAVFWTAAGLYSLRFIPFYALVMVPLMAEAISLRSGSRLRTGARLQEFAGLERAVVGGTLSVVILVLAGFTLLSTPGSRFEFSNSVFPIAALQALDGQPPGERVFNEFVWGGYLAYCCHPEIPVFIDGQVDYYGGEITADYVEAIDGGEAWRSVFDRHSIDWVLISPDAALAQVLVEADDWAETYRDETAVIFEPA